MERSAMIGFLGTLVGPIVTGVTTGTILRVLPAVVNIGEGGGAASNNEPSPQETTTFLVAGVALAAGVAVTYAALKR